MSTFTEIIELNSEETVNTSTLAEDVSSKDDKHACEEVEEEEDSDEDSDDEEEEEDWSEITIKGVVYYVNPEQTRWIKSNDMCPHFREYYPGIENDCDYDDLEPIMDE